MRHGSRCRPALGRRWIGIDITHLAINLIRHRLLEVHGIEVESSYKVVGEPTTLDEAEALAADDKYQFQWWALGLVGARPAQTKKGADKGIDGRLNFHEPGRTESQTAIISVKGGAVVPSAVRDLRGVVQREGAAIGVLITMRQPTGPMKVEAASAEFWQASNGRYYPRLQILTVEQLLAGKTIDYPPVSPGLTHRPQDDEQLVITTQPRRERLVVAPTPRSRDARVLVDDLLRSAGITGPPVQLEPILRQLNIELAAKPGQKEDAELHSMSPPGAPPTEWLVYYNPEKPEARRRYTIAHEVGHAILHADEWLGSAARGGGGRNRKRERDVERFAAELLMPTEMVAAAVAQYGDDVERLRRVFQVSRPAMEIRLRELGY